MKKIIICFCLFVSFIFSKEVRVSGDTIRFLGHLRFSGNLILLDTEDVSEINSTKNSLSECFEFSAWNNDPLVGSIQKAFFSLDKDSLFLSIIPSMPHDTPFYYYMSKVDSNKFNKYCMTKKSLPKELKELLILFFEKKYYSLYAEEDRFTYKFTHITKNQRKSITIPSSVFYLNRLGSFKKDYLELINLTKRYMLHSDSNCTWQKILKGNEEL